MRTVLLTAYDLAGAPLAGLTPVWTAYKNASTGADILPQPAITDAGSGWYRSSVDDDAVGIVDFGSTAYHRYCAAGMGATLTVFGAFDFSGAPLTGLAPAWSVLMDDTGVAYLPQPVIAEVGGGLYRFSSITSKHVVGSISLGVAANPAYIEYDSISPSSSYVMRAFDTSLGITVYWLSGTVDSTGANYTGPGPLSGIVIADVS